MKTDIEIAQLKKNEDYNPELRLLAANMLSQSLSFTLERKYLDRVTENPLFQLDCLSSSADADKTVCWIQISQIGKPLNDEFESCFTSIQKILYSCFLPQQTQLLFLITRNDNQNKIFLGVRAIDDRSLDLHFGYKICDFIKGIWPGVQCTVIEENDNKDLSAYKSNFQKGEKSYRHIYALTGIPSMENSDQGTYPATIDKLMAGMNNCSNYSYLVVADPIDSIDIDNMLYQCMDINGRAESMKSFNFSKNESLVKSYTEGISKKDLSTTTNKILAGLGAISFIGGIAGFIPQKSESESTSVSDNTTISNNIVSKQIEFVSEHLSSHSKRLETGKANGAWKVGVYLMAENKDDIKGASLQLRSILSGQESIYEPVRIHDISNWMNSKKGEVKTIKENTLAKCSSPTIMIDIVSTQKRVEHPLGKHFKELKTVLTTKELSYLINFPLRSVPGISVIDSTPDFSLNMQTETIDKTVQLGKMLYGGSETELTYSIPLCSLARHTLLSGINGSGKTNTVQSILNSLQGEIPFLVIEPAKTEYIDWAIEYNKKYPEKPIKIFVPGCKTFNSKQHQGHEIKDKLKLNPFQIVWLKETQEPNVLTHIDRLKSTFAAAFPMYDILPILMEDLIYTVYQGKTTDWLTKEPVYGETLFPTLNCMSYWVDEVMRKRKYEERIEQNMKACLNTRIDSLKRGWKGEMLNVLKSTDWKDLFDSKCVINLSYVGDDVDKSFFMALILQFLYEYRTACMELGESGANDDDCKHLCVIEEAHRVMANCTNPELPQYKSAMMFSNMLSEIRAYGQGMFLVDQIPTRLIPDAIKNTNLKITHRLVAEDDSKSIGESMGLNEEQRRVIPKLKIGQCLVAGSTDTDTYWIQVNKVK